MVSSSAWISFALVALISLATYTGVESGRYKRKDPCTKDFIRNKVIEICGRYKRSHEVSETRQPESSERSATGKSLERFSSSGAHSSLDTLFLGLYAADVFPELVSEQDLERYARAVKRLTHCCRHHCTDNDFRNAC